MCRRSQDEITFKPHRFFFQFFFGDFEVFGEGLLDSVELTDFLGHKAWIFGGWLGSLCVGEVVRVESGGSPAH